MHQPVTIRVLSILDKISPDDAFHYCVRTLQVGESATDMRICCVVRKKAAPLAPSRAYREISWATYDAHDKLAVLSLTRLRSHPHDKAGQYRSHDAPQVLRKPLWFMLTDVHCHPPTWFKVTSAKLFMSAANCTAVASRSQDMYHA